MTEETKQRFSTDDNRFWPRAINDAENSDDTRGVVAMTEETKQRFSTDGKFDGSWVIRDSENSDEVIVIDCDEKWLGCIVDALNKKADEGK